MSEISNATNELRRAFLRTKRKEHHLTQDEFAELFGMTKDCYRKYENGERRIPDNIYRMMNIIINNLEEKGICKDMVSVNDFIEEIRQASLISVFDKSQHDLVNVIFDFIIRKLKEVK